MIRREPPPSGLQVSVVGPCASGKSTLVGALRRYGIQARQIAQEHSYVPAMWQILARPDVLIYLNASYPTCTARKALDWSEREYLEQLQRLRHARQHCNLLVDTDGLTPEAVLEAVLHGLGLGPGVGGTV